MSPGALSIQPKSPEISVGSSNGTDHISLVRPEYSGPALKVVHCDRSGHFSRSDRNVRGSHDYLRAHKGSRRMSRPLIQGSSVRALFSRYIKKIIRSKLSRYSLFYKECKRST